MTNEYLCTFGGTRDEALVSYLYGELTGGERAAFDRHLRECGVCRAELDELSAVRGGLAEWAPPAIAGRLASDIVPRPVPRTRMAATFADLPVWARAAAALLVVGLSAGAANLEVTRTSDGLSVRTGWRHPAPAIAVAPQPAPTAPVVHVEDLASLEQEIQALRARVEAAASGASASDQDLVRRVRAMLDESESRQQRELALRVAEVARDLQAQRQADLVRIDRNLGLIQSRTGMEVMRTQRQVNSLAQQVSQRP